MIDVSSWIVGSLGLEVHEDPLLDWGKSLEVEEAAGAEALVSSILHALQVSHVTVGDIAVPVGGVFLVVVVGLGMLLLIIVIVVDVLGVMEVAGHGS